MEDFIAQCIQNGKNGKKFLSRDRATCALTHDCGVCTGRARVGCNREVPRKAIGRTLSVASSPSPSPVEAFLDHLAAAW